MRPAHWLPPVVWMAVILSLASDAGSAEHTSRLILPVLRFVFPGASPLQLDAMHLVVRKLAHVSEYAILAALWLRALVAGRGLAPRPAAWGALAIAVAWAIVDESYQSTVGSRTGSPVDVAIDAAGALAVAVSGRFGWRPTVDALTATLLWAAAIGGAALLALDAAAGVSSGLLWLAVPGALAGLLLRRRWRRIVRDGVR